MLGEANPQAMDLVLKIEKVLGVEYQDHWVVLRNQVSVFQFEKAMETLQQFVQMVGLEDLDRDDG